MKTCSDAKAEKFDRIIKIIEGHKKSINCKWQTDSDQWTQGYKYGINAIILDIERGLNHKKGKENE